jgi:hypothetical protein
MEDNRVVRLQGFPPPLRRDASRPRPKPRTQEHPRARLTVRPPRVTSPQAVPPAFAGATLPHFSARTPKRPKPSVSTRACASGSFPARGMPASLETGGSPRVFGLVSILTRLEIPGFRHIGSPRMVRIVADSFIYLSVKNPGSSPAGAASAVFFPSSPCFSLCVLRVLTLRRSYGAGLDYGPMRVPVSWSIRA